MNQTKSQRKSQIRAAIAYARAGGDVSGEEWRDYRVAMRSFREDSTGQISWPDFFAGLSVRARKGIYRAGIDSFEKLLAEQDEKGQRVNPYYWKNCGTTTVTEMKEKLRAIGIEPPKHW